MVEAIIGIVGGGLIGWFTNRHFYIRQLKAAKEDAAVLSKRHQEQVDILNHQSEQLEALRTENAELKQQIGGYKTEIGRLREYADPHSHTNFVKLHQEKMKHQNEVSDQRMELHNTLDWERRRNRHRGSD